MEKGITLVALVITIIVLLILSAVAIGAIAGPDGLISKAKQSAEEYNKAAKDEADTVDNLIDMLEKVNNPVETITAPDIDADPSKYYGKEVKGYTVPNYAPITWEIFYADTENIYLIASNYVENKYAPNASDGTEVGKYSTNQISFDKILNSYTGTADIRKEDELVKKWISHIDSYTSTYANMKATAYLLDTNAWSGFKDTKYAEYAVGAPTLELFIASYNDIHPGIDLRWESMDEYGYNHELKWNTIENDGSEENKDDDLYLLENRFDYSGWWLASPNEHDYYNGAGSNLFFIGDNGGIGYYHSYMSVAKMFRPIVCLKSEVELVELEDGNYVIYS